MNIKKVILLLQSKEITQSEIAVACGCTQSNISCLTRDRTENPRPSSKVVDGLRKLLAVHGLPEPIDDELLNIS